MQLEYINDSLSLDSDTGIYWTRVIVDLGPEAELCFNQDPGSLLDLQTLINRILDDLIPKKFHCFAFVHFQDLGDSTVLIVGYYRPANQIEFRNYEEEKKKQKARYKSYLEKEIDKLKKELDKLC
jgi:hypothetical protein